MGMSGFICHDDYYDRLQRLSDEEVGHLFRQLMLYHAGRFEEMTDFIDNEGIAFDFIVRDIDRVEEKQNATSETNRINGSKGGRPKKRTEPEETEDNRPKPTETEANPIKPYKDKEKDIYKENNNNPPITPLIDDSEARAIQSDHDKVLDAAKNAGFPNSPIVNQMIIQLYAEYGLEKVLDGFSECAAHSANSVAYLKAVLKGGPKKPKARVAAQDFAQRDYSGVQDELNDTLAREIEEMKRQEAMQ